MYSKLYELLLPRIGRDAAKAALINQYANVVLVALGLMAIVISYTGGEHPPRLLVSLTLLILLAFSAVIYTKVRVARSLTRYLKVRVRWFEVPKYSSISKFDEWLQNKKLAR
jgi:hypothetical protein